MQEQRKLEERYKKLIADFCGIGLVSQGSVMHTPPGAWRWTRKVTGKTVSLGLSAEQATQMKEAIANQRAMDVIIDEMRSISQKLILWKKEKSPKSIKKTNSSKKP